MLVLALWAKVVIGAEIIPSTPAKYFNDYANVISADVAGQLNQKLEQFERDTSSQVVVAIYPKMQTDSSMEDYTVRVAQSWKVGQAGKKNGTVLFVFIQDRKMRIEVGYGLEGALPDALCKRIIEDEIKPHFRVQNFNAGVAAGVNAILAAAKGEYQGTGRTVNDGAGGSRNENALFIFLFVIFVLFILFGGLRRGRRRGWLVTSSGWSGGGWGGSGGGGWSSGGGGGGFSGGGGSFGGGGASGSW